MKPVAFDYSQPSSLSETVELLDNEKTIVKVVAGGQTPGSHQGLLPCFAGTLTGISRLEIVIPNDLPLFELLLKRWIVERRFA